MLIDMTYTLSISTSLGWLTLRLDLQAIVKAVHRKTRCQKSKILT